MRRRAAAATVVLFGSLGIGALGCTRTSSTATGGPDASVSVTQTVGPEGGTVTSSDGLVRLIIPPTALSQATPISIAIATDAPPGAIGDVYDIEPTGTTFAVPAMLAITVDPAQVSSAPDQPLQLATVVQGAWAPQPWSSTAGSDHVVSSAIQHLSEWAVVPVAKDPCLCHVAEWEKCCTSLGGVHGNDDSPAACTCVGANWPDLTSCYTLASGGGPGIKNFCDDCLNECCKSAGGTLYSKQYTPMFAQGDACDCYVDTFAQSTQVKECSARCFGPSDDVTVCTAPTGTGGPEDAGVDAGADASGDASPDAGGNGPGAGDAAADANADAAADASCAPMIAANGGACAGPYPCGTFTCAAPQGENGTATCGNHTYGLSCSGSCPLTCTCSTCNAQGTQCVGAINCAPAGGSYPCTCTTDGVQSGTSTYWCGPSDASPPSAWSGCMFPGSP